MAPAKSIMLYQIIERFETKNYKGWDFWEVKMLMLGLKYYTKEKTTFRNPLSKIGAIYMH